MSKKFSPESATAMLALVGVTLPVERAPSVADTLAVQIEAANVTFARLDFEIEPATYLVVRDQEAP